MIQEIETVCLSSIPTNLFEAKIELSNFNISKITSYFLKKYDEIYVDIQKSCNGNINGVEGSKDREKRLKEIKIKINYTFSYIFKIYRVSSNFLFEDNPSNLNSLPSNDNLCQLLTEGSLIAYLKFFKSSMKNIEGSLDSFYLLNLIIFAIGEYFLEKFSQYEKNFHSIFNEFIYEKKENQQSEVQSEVQSELSLSSFCLLLPHFSKAFLFVLSQSFLVSFHLPIQFVLPNSKSSILLQNLITYCLTYYSHEDLFKYSLDVINKSDAALYQYPDNLISSSVFTENYRNFWAMKEIQWTEQFLLGFTSSHVSYFKLFDKNKDSLCYITAAIGKFIPSDLVPHAIRVSLTLLQQMLMISNNFYETISEEASKLPIKGEERSSFLALLVYYLMSRDIVDQYVLSEFPTSYQSIDSYYELLDNDKDLKSDVSITEMLDLSYSTRIHCTLSAELLIGKIISFVLDNTVNLSLPFPSSNMIKKILHFVGLYNIDISKKENFDKYVSIPTSLRLIHLKIGILFARIFSFDLKFEELTDYENQLLRYISQFYKSDQKLIDDEIENTSDNLDTISDSSESDSDSDSDFEIEPYKNIPKINKNSSEIINQIKLNKEINEVVKSDPVDIYKEDDIFSLTIDPLLLKKIPQLQTNYLSECLELLTYPQSNPEARPRLLAALNRIPIILNYILPSIYILDSPNLVDLERSKRDQYKRLPLSEIRKKIPCDAEDLSIPILSALINLVNECGITHFNERITRCVVPLLVLFPNICVPFIFENVFGLSILSNFSSKSVPLGNVSIGLMQSSLKWLRIASKELSGYFSLKTSSTQSNIDEQFLSLFDSSLSSIDSSKTIIKRPTILKNKIMEMKNYKQKKSLPQNEFLPYLNLFFYPVLSILNTLLDANTEQISFEVDKSKKDIEDIFGSGIFVNNVIKDNSQGSSIKKIVGAKSIIPSEALLALSSFLESAPTCPILTKYTSQLVDIALKYSASPSNEVRRISYASIYIGLEMSNISYNTFKANPSSYYRIKNESNTILGTLMTITSATADALTEESLKELSQSNENPLLSEESTIRLLEHVISTVEKEDDKMCRDLKVAIFQFINKLSNP